MCSFFPWCTPWEYERLTEPQIYGFSTRIPILEKHAANTQAAATAAQLAPLLMSLLYGGKKSNGKH
jgi:hypothetical protein